MTRTGFIFAKTLATLGIAPMERYRTAAAFEMHLLRDSEVIVGELVWETAESIESVSAEYWKLRQLKNREQELNKEVTRLTAILKEAQENRAQVLAKVTENTNSGTKERDAIIQRIEELMLEQEECQKIGLAIKKAYSGLKTKLEVLTEESNGEENDLIKETRKKQNEKRTEFEKAKIRRDEVNKGLGQLKEKLEKLNIVIHKNNFANQSQAEEQVGSIGQTNRELTNIKSKLGQIDVTKSELHAEVGRYYIENSKTQLIKQVSREHRNLLNLINKVKYSSSLHRRIIDS